MKYAESKNTLKLQFYCLTHQTLLIFFNIHIYLIRPMKNYVQLFFFKQRRII